MQTVLHTYKFDTSQPDEKAAWCELRAKLKNGPPCHGPVLADVWASFRELDGQTVELETKHLFDNQWNSTTRQLFDWALESSGMRHIRRGHYLEQTAEMRDIRRNTNRCGYCGKQEEAARGTVFCPHCIDSEYLKESDLHLTRMRAIDHKGDIGPLTEAERAHLLPIYRLAQTKGSTVRGTARINKWYEGVEKKCARAIQCANNERDGLLWLAAHGLTQIAMANVIYYSHTDRFGFGWRKPLSAGELAIVLEEISEFRFGYDIKCENGRTLSGN